MAVPEANRVDMMSVDPKTGIFWLSMVEVRPWDQIPPSFKELEAKTNFYIGAIKSGDLAQKVPDAMGRTLGIRLISKTVPNDAGMHILSLTRAGCDHFGIPFSVVRMEGEGFVEIPIKPGAVAGVRQVPEPKPKKPWWKLW